MLMACVMAGLGLGWRGGRFGVGGVDQAEQPSLSDGEEGLNAKKGIGEAVGVENAILGAFDGAAQIIARAPPLHDGVFHVVAKVAVSVDGLGVGFKQG